MNKWFAGCDNVKLFELHKKDEDGGDDDDNDHDDADDCPRRVDHVENEDPVMVILKR